MTLDGVFARLLREPGVEEQLELRSSLGFMALHGGNQDRVTDVIARQAAERAGASLYAVVQPPHLRWHIPSWRYTPAASPRLATFLDHVDVVVSVHGHGADAFWMDWQPPAEWYPRWRPEERVLLGGRNRELASRVAGALRDALPGCPVVDDLDAIPRGVRGLHRHNPVNLTRGGGVQVELPPQVRGLRPSSPPVAIGTVAGALAAVAR
ncbi:MAG: hypothetical protein E6G17_12000 [Actinobacteria bacterium]|nr:MAG: hypothetical protein E6G17_12000 [Actinomycetota bacterium]